MVNSAIAGVGRSHARPLRALLHGLRCREALDTDLSLAPLSSDTPLDPLKTCRTRLWRRGEETLTRAQRRAPKGAYGVGRGLYAVGGSTAASLSVPEAGAA